MATRFYIPHELVKDIMQHVRHAEISTLGSFIQTHSDEDTVVESLGSRLRCGRRSVFVSEAEMNGIWKWSIAHTKFRGRGPGADEHYVGADVILEFRFLSSRSMFTTVHFFSAKW